MSVQDLIAQLRDLDVKLWVEGEKLRYSAPPDVMTTARLKQLADNKQAVIEWLNCATNSNNQAIKPIKAVPRDQPLETSFAQERLLFISSLMPGTDSYNVPLSLRLTGVLNTSALQKSLNAIVTRHESLRTNFVNKNGQYLQLIHQSQALPLTYISLTGYEQEKKKKKLSQIIARERTTSFDLSADPVIRATLIQLAENDHVLLITLHHIVCDGWSLGILFKDLSHLFSAYSSAASIDIAELKIQYADYAMWQRKLLSGVTLERLVSYWRKKLDGHSTLQLPTDYPRPQIQTFEGGQIVKLIPGDLSAGIRQLSEQAGATLFMTMLASFSIILHRYCHQDDIVIGTPIANRNRYEIEDIIGFFVNMLVIRTDVSGSPTFETLLKRVKATALEAYQHQDLPFEKLVEELKTERDLSRNPLFQVSFAMQNTPVDTVQLQGLNIEPLQMQEVTTTRFDLEVNVRENSDSLVISCIYNTRLYRKDTIERMLGHYQQLLKNIVAEPRKSVDKLSILTDEEANNIIYQWNQTQHKLPHSRLVHQSVEKAAIDFSAHSAIVSSEKSLDYSTLNNTANQLAHYLLNLGAGSSAPVTVLMNRSPDMIVALLAILKTGSHYVPVDPEYPEKRLAYILDDTKCDIVITQSDLMPRLSGFSGHVVCMDKIVEKLKLQSIDNPDVLVTPDHTAYIIYTSGSTGEPKGVEITHAGLANLVAWHQREYCPGIDDRASHLAGLGFDASVWEIWPYITCGTSLYLAPDELRLSASALWQWIVAQGITLSFMPTPLAEAMLAEITPAALAKSDFALRVLLTGGDKLHGALSRQALPFRVVNHYGPTENTVVATCIDVDVLDAEEPAIGRPIDNVQTYILDKYMQAVPVGVTGDLYIGGNSLAKGYINQPELNREKFVINPFSTSDGERLYNTGDLARYREDGAIEFAGRSDLQIKLRGFRIEPGEIEAILNHHQGVQSSTVLLHSIQNRDSSETKQLMAYIIASGAKDITEDELLSTLQEQLPAYMVPSDIIFIDELPLTANGKLDKTALPVPQLKSQLANSHIAPDSELEKNIAAIWRDLLKLDEVGIRENFFDLGGHSLLLGKLHAKLTEELDADIAMVDLFRYTTIESQARYLGGDESLSAFAEQIKQRMRHRHEINNNDDAIAVTGMAGQFPGAHDIETFWQNLIEGVESIRFYSDEELSAAGISEAVFNSPDYVPARGHLDDAELFDAAFFSYSPHEAELIDPQQRLFLECSWHALEHAACDPRTYNGLISVFAGASKNGYLNNLYSRPDLLATSGMQVVISSEKDFLATRVSYKLDLKGPSFTLQTACSTSLVAIHEACRNLQNYDCDVALAGGVSVNVPRVNGYTYQQGSILSPDGHCRAFDAEANGTVGGEGVGVVVLKRLRDAIADHDTIHAVIKGSAINNDGAEKAGFTAPGIQGQVSVVAMAHASADVSADTIDYVETHGTGTTLGDPIEVSALTLAFSQNNSEQYAGTSHNTKTCALGAVKTNIGHLDAAAGVAGFIKTILSLENEKIPPSLHYTEANPGIDFERSPFYVNNIARDWPLKTNSPRRAGVSSFGIGGTNAHIILEQAPQADIGIDNSEANSEAEEELILLSAKTGTALESKIKQLAAHIQSQDNIRLKDISYTLQLGRSMLEHRCMLVCNQTDEAVTSLLDKNPQNVSLEAGSVAARKIVFMFSGQGSQYPDMAKDLYRHYEVFRHTVDSCCERLRPHIDINLLDLLFPQTDGLEHAAQQLTLTQYAQCSLFVIEYATAKLWMHWGVKPSAMIGHSIGEYVAACLSGVISLNDALVLVANRGRLMQDQPSGSMLSVPVSVAEIQAIMTDELAENLSVATVNSPAMCVISGEDSYIESLEKLLQQEEYNARRLHTSHAFHSSMMQAVLEPFTQLFDRIKLNTPEIPFISNLTGDWIKDSEATDTAYWGRHLRNTVLFSDGLKTLMQEDFNCFVETGPGNTLSTFARQHTAFSSAASDVCIISSIRHPRQPQSDTAFLLNSLGRIWLSGHPLDWQLINKTKSAQRIPLPVYPFERKRYWIERDTAAASQLPGETQSIHKNTNIEAWAYIPAWKPSLMQALDKAPDVSGQWIVFASNSACCESIIRYLEEHEAEVICITAAKDYEHLSESRYTLNPANKKDFERFFTDNNTRLEATHRVIHCWGLNDSNDADNTVSAAVLENEYYSLLYMVQAMQAVRSDLSVHVNVLTQYSQSVNGQETVIPEKSMSAALLKVLSQEVPGLRYNICDINDEEIGSQVKQSAEMPEMLQSILSTCLSQKTNQIDAYRYNRRWLQSYDNVDLPAVESDQLPLRLRMQGVYLITGGLGGVGLSIAHYLAEKVQARLVLTARSPLPERSEWDRYTQTNDESDKVSQIIHQLKQLEESGAEVMVASVDVSDLKGMQELLDNVTTQYGHINGVVHAAGVVSGASMAGMQALTYEDCELQFLPKVHGLMVLNKLFDNYPLDFVMPVSSLSSVLGGLGFAAYSAANQYMDSLCQQHYNQGRTRWLSVNWEGWQFAQNNTDSAVKAEGSSSALMLSMSEGRQVFERILNLPGLAQLVVSTGNLEARLKQWVYLDANDKSGDIMDDSTETASYERPELSSDLVEAETDSQILMAEIWRSLFSISNIGIHDNFFELGGHSLLAVQAVAAIRDKFNVTITIDKFLELGTVETTASYIDAMKWAAESSSDEGMDEDDRNEFEL